MCEIGGGGRGRCGVRMSGCGHYQGVGCLGHLQTLVQERGKRRYTVHDIESEKQIFVHNNIIVHVCSRIHVYSTCIQNHCMNID